MQNWLTSKDKKRHQRAMNKLMRNLNKNIENDSLWKGRFYIRQIASDWLYYEDKSGGTLYVRLRFYDRKTGITKDVWDTVNHWRFLGGSNLFWAMNDFIIKDVDVWNE